MKVFKFGGASVKDAESVSMLPDILRNYQDEELVIILSAMGKITNAMEQLTESIFHGDDAANKHYSAIRNFHLDIVKQLFPDESHKIYMRLDDLLMEMQALISAERSTDYDIVYDQLVPFGELLSTTIVSAFLNDRGIASTWMDARELVFTDSTHRAAYIDWEKSEKAITEHVMPVIKSGEFLITQGFIGSDGNKSTTLGREGSDFSAAIFANILDAEQVVVWKDVPGYLNADPQYFEETVKLDRISYAEAIELAFYGAKIIHPKTIRPLKNKGIPLLVKSFLEPELEGSVIHEDSSSDAMIPSYIIKESQVLISIASRDVSFIAEDNLHAIFGLFAEHRTGINMMQNSAISFSVCVDASPRVDALIEELQNAFSVKYNEDLQLITIRHYTPDTLEKLTSGREILLEQKSRVTVQMIIK